MPASQLLTAAVAFAAAAAANAAPRALEKMILADFVHERSVHNPHFFTWEEQNDPVLGAMGGTASRLVPFTWAGVSMGNEARVSWRSSTPGWWAALSNKLLTPEHLAPSI